MTKKGKILGPHTAAQLGLSENHIFVDTRSNLFACLSKNVLIGAYSGEARFQTDVDCLHYLYSIVGTIDIFSHHPDRHKPTTA